jgi:hypothetical protein
MPVLSITNYLDPETLKISAQMVSTLVGLVALFISFRNEHRNQVRFQQQLDFSKSIAEANVRPLLALTISAYLDRKALELVNHGSGTAVITNIVFRRHDREASCVVDVIDLGRQVVWDDFTELEDTIEYLPSKASDTLIELTTERLTEQGITESEAEALMGNLESQLDEVKVIVTYEDVLGNIIAEAEQLN